ncbi:MAG: S41 family peptidase [Candidatus Sulfotelmatobacter sp.]
MGYLMLNAFPDTSVCQAIASADMAKLNDADAVIFDLRDNRGGFPSMVSLIAAYLFDHPEYLYCPLEKHNSRIVDALAGSRQQTR